MIKKQCLTCQDVFSADSAICDKDGTPLATILVESLIDVVLAGRYRILSELGRGGMGVVYKAQPHDSEKPVAIKMLLNDLKDDEVSLRRFEVEAEACRALDHPNVIKLYDFAMSEFGLPFIAMEFLEGDTLQTALKKDRKIKVERALPLFIQICNALDHAHRRLVIHRDLKPSNIVLRVNGDGAETAILVDFGIAKLFTQAGKNALRLTKTGEIFGSPLYMSPEQCMGQVIDNRSDIYSLGCMMYETLTGLPPITGENFLNVIFRHVSDTPAPFSEIAPDIDVPEDLERAIFKTLNKKAQDRFASMTELKQALEHVQQVMLGGVEASNFEIKADIQAAENDIIASYRERAENGDASAQYDLAWYYFEGDCVKECKQTAFNWFMQAAKQEYAPAENQVGRMFEKGLGVEQDEKEAVEWYRKAAIKANLRAQFNLAYCYEYGVGLAKDQDLAFYWYLKAALQGDADSQIAVGWAYQYGEGAKADIYEAVQWFRKSAEQGNQWAQWQLAECYREGLGVRQNVGEAAAWMMCASAQGCPQGQYGMALMFESGEGVETDLSEYVRWLTLAAEQDYVKAQVALGIWYQETGETIEAIEQAVKWFEAAADNGDTEAQERFFKCRKKLKELQETQKRQN